MSTEHFRPIITSRQLLYLLIAATMPTQDLLLPGPLIKAFGKDALWAILVGGILAVVPLLLALYILRRQRCGPFVAAFGSHLFVARVFAALLFVVAALGLSNIFASFAQMLHVDLLEFTPASVTTLLAAFVAIYAALGGPEVIGRVAELLTPIVLIEVPMLFGLAMPWFNFVHMFPLTPQDGHALTLGAYQAFSFLAEVGFAVYFGSLARDPEGIPRALWTALGVNVLMLLLTTGMPLLMFGPEHSSILAAPTVTAVRTIHYGFLIERLDSLMTAPWAAFVIVKIVVWTTFASGLLGDVFGRRAYRPAVWALILVASYASLRMKDLGAVETSVKSLWYDSGAPLLVLTLVLAAAFLRWQRRRPARA